MSYCFHISRLLITIDIRGGAILITTAGAPRRGGIVLLTTSILINVKCSTGLSNQITIVGASHLTNVLDITTLYSLLLV